MEQLNDNESFFLYALAIFIFLFICLVLYLGHRKSKRDRGIIPDGSITKEFEYLQNKIETAPTPTELVFYDTAIDDFYDKYANRNHPYASACLRRLITSYNKRSFDLRAKGPFGFFK